MAHPRKLIRHAVVALLTNATAAGARVLPTRVEPHKRTQLPAISVYTTRDPVNADSFMTAPVELEHSLQLEVAGWVAHSDSYSVDDQMDDLAEQIEAAMDIDVYFGGTAGDSVLTDTVMEVLEEDGRSDPLIGIVVLTYLVTYRSSPAVIDARPGDFVTADVKQKLVGGVVDTTIAEDTFIAQESP